MPRFSLFDPDPPSAFICICTSSISRRGNVGGHFSLLRQVDMVPLFFSSIVPFSHLRSCSFTDLIDVRPILAVLSASPRLSHGLWSQCFLPTAKVFSRFHCLLLSFSFPERQNDPPRFHEGQCQRPCSPGLFFYPSSEKVFPFVLKQPHCCPLMYNLPLSSLQNLSTALLEESSYIPVAPSFF